MQKKGENPLVIGALRLPQPRYVECPRAPHTESLNAWPKLWTLSQSAHLNHQVCRPKNPFAYRRDPTHVDTARCPARPARR